MMFVIDMNLSPSWCDFLEAAGWEASHWLDIGVATAPDVEIMSWAARQQRVVLTHDLDFGALLAATRANGPSVVPVRTQDVRPAVLGPQLIPVLRHYEQELTAGALLVFDLTKWRVRLLPLSPRE